jgi:vacuolar-type H+-ATPase subunit H
MEVYVSYQDTRNSIGHIPAGEIMTEKGIEEIRKIKNKEDEIQAMLEKASKDCQAQIESAQKSMEDEIRKAEENFSKKYSRKISALQDEVNKKIEESRERARKDAESISLNLTDKKAADLIFKFMKQNME